MKLGLRIRKLLTEKHITQRVMANDLHLSPATINGYLQARRLPDCETLARIAAYLDTSADYLLGTASVDTRPGFSLNSSERLLLENYRAMNDSKKHIIMELSAEFSSGDAPCGSDSSDF